MCFGIVDTVFYQGKIRKNLMVNFLGDKTMQNKTVLLKLGGRKHLGEERWVGALTLFDEVYATRFLRSQAGK